MSEQDPDATTGPAKDGGVDQASATAANIPGESAGAPSPTATTAPPTPAIPDGYEPERFLVDPDMGDHLSVSDGAHTTEFDVVDGVVVAGSPAEANLLRHVTGVTPEGSSSELPT